jgi:hypothetical protein
MLKCRPTQKLHELIATLSYMSNEVESTDEVMKKKEADS